MSNTNPAGNERAARTAWVEMHQQALFAMKARHEGDAVKEAKYKKNFEATLQRYTRMTGRTTTLEAAAKGFG